MGKPKPSNIDVPDPREIIEAQTEANRTDVTTPFGRSYWDGSNQITEFSPQMQGLADRTMSLAGQDAQRMPGMGHLGDIGAAIAGKVGERYGLDSGLGRFNAQRGAQSGDGAQVKPAPAQNLPTVPLPPQGAPSAPATPPIAPPEAATPPPGITPVSNRPPREITNPQLPGLGGTYDQKNATTSALAKELDEEERRRRQLMMNGALNSGGGWGGALGQMANAYALKRAGQ